MSDDKIYSKEELEGMNRLNLRRICKARGMSSEECAQQDFDDLVAWILEQQGGGGGGKTTKKSTSKKSTPKSSAKSSTKSTPKSSGKGSAPASDAAQVEEKIDTVGHMLDELTKVVNALAEDVAEMRMDVYQTKELQMHQGLWLEAEEVLRGENAPDDMGFGEKLEALEEACSGEDDSGE